MSARIRLERQLDVRSWVVTGRIARLERREWEPAIVLLAIEQGGLSVDVVARELLNGRRAYARRLIATCERYGLLSKTEDGFAVTDEGRRAAETQDVFVPRSGTWTIWASPDPLLQSPILLVQPWDAGSARGERRPEPVPVPSWVLPSAGVSSVDAEGTPLRVLDFGEQSYGEPAEPGTDLAVALAIDGDHVQTQLLSHDEERRAIRDLPRPPIDVPALRSALLQAAEDAGWPNAASGGAADGVWNTELGVIEVPFSSASEAERAALLRDVVLQSVRSNDHGVFDTATIDGVPLGPRTAADADAWALWRLIHSIDDFATDARYEQWRDRAARLFPAHAVRLPDRQTLAEQLRIAPGASAANDAPSTERAPVQTPTWWHLSAPHDWGL